MTLRCSVNTYQENTITEHATLGLACILVEHRAGMEITEVTNGGDGPDYWLGKNKDLVLEVSGRQTCHLPTLLKEKTEQLRKNPYEKGGYVCVAEYEGRTVFLVHCEFEVS